MRCVWLLILCLVTLAAPFPATADDFPLKNGDVWVMAGDSITAQHLHSNYFEAFCFARYPKLKFAFRNSGVGGHTIPTTLARFDYDIAAWKPTIVSVELGMNDKGRFSTEEYIANMMTMVRRIREIQARPVMLTASPVNNGDTMANLGGNQRLNEYAVALKKFSVDQKIPFADQFHGLIDIWGKNKPAENLANALPLLRALSQDDKVAGADGLRAFLKAQDALPTVPVSMQGDAVHPGPPGQLMMAAALLKDLGAETFVSHAALEASGKIVEAKGCQIEKVEATPVMLKFDWLDEAGPLPIPDQTAAVMPLFPAIAELSDYTLAVKGLGAGNYQLSIDGVPVFAPLPASDWEKGVNLAELAYRPLKTDSKVNAIVAQGRAILTAVAAKESLVGQWRALSQRAHADGAAPSLKTELAELTKKVEAEDEKIRAAAAPKTRRFQLAIVPNRQ